MMIDILTNNFIQALNTNNDILLNYLLDDQCEWTDSNRHRIVGKEAVIKSLIDTYRDRQLKIINGKKSDERSLILLYQCDRSYDQDPHTLFIRHNHHNKICLIHTLA